MAQAGSRVVNDRSRVSAEQSEGRHRLAGRPERHHGEDGRPNGSGPRWGSWSTGGWRSRRRSWEPPSWDEIVRAPLGRVYRLAYRLTGNQHDAEDLTQDVFVRVFRSLSDYRPGTFEGWLHRITTNLFLDHVRRRARQRSYPLGGRRRPVARGHRTGPGAARRGVLPDVQARWTACRPDFRAAVVLCDVEGLTLRGDRRGAEHQAGNRAQPDPPGPRPHALVAGPPGPQTPHRRGREEPMTTDRRYRAEATGGFDHPGHRRCRR
jgi:DNA-directed RNA polymerase specialized sigma24 family protein